MLDEASFGISLYCPSLYFSDFSSLLSTLIRFFKETGINLQIAQYMLVPLLYTLKYNTSKQSFILVLGNFFGKLFCLTCEYVIEKISSIITLIGVIVKETISQGNLANLKLHCDLISMLLSLVEKLEKFEKKSLRKLKGKCSKNCN